MTASTMTTQLSQNTTSDTFDIIAIYPNDLSFTAANYESLVPDALKYCKIIKVTHDDLMYVLYDMLEMNEDIIGDSDIVYENGSYIYQLFHNSENLCASEESSKMIKLKSSADMVKNSVATCLVNANKKINGVAILICSKIQPNLLCTTHSVTMYDVVELLKKTFSHIGNIINVDDSVIPFTYESPLDGISDASKLNYNFVESTIYGLHLIGCYDNTVNMSPENYNKKASILLATSVYGSARICLATETKFLDIEGNLINDVFYCCLHSDEKKYDTTEDMAERTGCQSEDVVKEGLSLVKNSYTLIARRASRFRVPCSNKLCEEKCKVDRKAVQDYEYKCKNCHFVFYHNEECMKLAGGAHDDACPGN